MKRKGYLYEKIISIENLYEAEKKARKGKRWQTGVIEFDKNKDGNILALHQMLVKREFKTSPYSVFKIFDKKERDIFVLPYYEDRILQHAILRIISPIFIKCFISQTYSCIPKRGIHKCLIDIYKSLKYKEGTLYCLQIDIKKYYPNINKSTLKLLLRRKFKDRELLSLLDEIIDSNELGCPIGNYLSQWFGNFYLTYFDHWLKEEKGLQIFRYMDNICILHESKEYLNDLKKEIEYYLSNILDLTLSNAQIFPVDVRGIDIVGYRIFRTHIWVRKSIKENFRKMMKYNRNDKSIASYNGWFSWGNCKNLKNKFGM